MFNFGDKILDEFGRKYVFISKYGTREGLFVTTEGLFKFIDLSKAHKVETFPGDIDVTN